MNEPEDLEPNKSEDEKFLAQKCDTVDNKSKQESARTEWLNKTACVFFGTGWLPIQFVFAQLPYIIHTAPESWSLPSYVMIAISLGNIATLLHYLNKRRLIPYDSLFIFAIFFVNIVSLIGLAFTYDIVVPINGRPRSLFLFIFVILVSCGGCMSALLCLPFMARLKKEYLVSYFIGQGLDSSVSGLLGLLQVMTNHGKCLDSSEMLFNSKAFFLIGAFFVFLSAISFFRLSKQVDPKGFKEECKSAKETKSHFQRSYFVVLLALRALFSFFNYGVLAGVQSYSCLPYPHGKLVYQVTVSANQFLGGIIVYLISFTKLRSTKRLLAMSAVQLAISSYEITTAFMSPTPPMVHSLVGSVHIAFVWISGCIVSFYTGVSIPAILRERSPKHLYYYGAATQVGAVMGALCSFVTINFTNLLHSIDIKPCQP